MSWWVYVCKDGQPRHGDAQCWDAYERNVTYNNSRIFRHAFAGLLSEGLASLDGIRAGIAAGLCEIGVKGIESDRAAFDQLEPDNGWGGVDDSLDLLRGIHKAGLAHPDGVVIVS